MGIPDLHAGFPDDAVRSRQPNAHGFHVSVRHHTGSEGTQLAVQAVAIDVSIVLHE